MTTVRSAWIDWWKIIQTIYLYEEPKSRPTIWIILLLYHTNTRNVNQVTRLIIGSSQQLYNILNNQNNFIQIIKYFCGFKRDMRTNIELKYRIILIQLWVLVSRPNRRMNIVQRRPHHSPRSWISVSYCTTVVCSQKKVPSRRVSMWSHVEVEQ